MLVPQLWVFSRRGEGSYEEILCETPLINFIKLRRAMKITTLCFTNLFSFFSPTSLVLYCNFVFLNFLYFLFYLQNLIKVLLLYFYGNCMHNACTIGTSLYKFPTRYSHLQKCYPPYHIVKVEIIIK